MEKALGYGLINSMQTGKLHIMNQARTETIAVLGGTGKETGDRHPKIASGVLIGAGAKILGNIHIGQCSRVASGSVVLKNVPDHVTVAGVPARVVGKTGDCTEPSRDMDQLLDEEVTSE